MKGLPKVELHLHLEGGAPPAFIRGLAREKSVDIGGIFNEDGSYRFRDFWDFLKVYEAATSVLTTPEDYARLHGGCQRISKNETRNNNHNYHSYKTEQGWEKLLTVHQAEDNSPC